MITDSVLSAKFGRKAQHYGFIKADTSNVVVYTRVSSKEQADKNMSLDTQRRVIEEYVEKTKLTIVGYFGGTYESAKTDGRKEFKRMLEFIKKSTSKVSQVLVYSMDRFSRTGGGAIKLASDLREQYGIGVFAITQPTDISNPSGILHQNIQLLFSEYDNQERRKKAVAGMKAKFEKGMWVVKPPQGYDIVKSNGERKIVLSEEGKKIKKAWQWKLEGMKNDEIVLKLQAIGVKMYKQQIGRVFTNPFYCGMMAHGMLNGRVIEGTHEKMISRDVFMRVNGIVESSTRYGVPHKNENENLPLKVFIRCSACNEPFTGYIVKKKNLYYYKCRTTGCKCNRSAKETHKLFLEELVKFEVRQDLIEAILYEAEYGYAEMNKENVEKEAMLTNQLAEINRNLDKLEEKYFIKEEMSRETYDKLLARYQEEKNKIQTELDKYSQSISNLIEVIKRIIELCLNLPQIWAKGDVFEKEKLQKLIFPEGIVYDKEKGVFRTSKINSVIAEIARRSGDLALHLTGPPPTFKGWSLSAGWRLQLDNNEPIRFDAFPSNPEISFQVTKIQLPADFIPELDKIEGFYDLHLQELLPISVGKQGNNGTIPQQAKENRTQANSGKLVG